MGVTIVLTSSLAIPLLFAYWESAVLWDMVTAHRMPVIVIPLPVVTRLTLQLLPCLVRTHLTTKEELGFGAAEGEEGREKFQCSSLITHSQRQRTRVTLECPFIFLSVFPQGPRCSEYRGGHTEWCLRILPTHLVISRPSLCITPLHGLRASAWPLLQGIYSLE